MSRVMTLPNDARPFRPADEGHNLRVGALETPALLINPAAHVGALVACALGRANRLEGVAAALASSNNDVTGLDSLQYMAEEVTLLLEAIAMHPQVRGAGDQPQEGAA